VSHITEEGLRVKRARRIKVELEATLAKAEALASGVGKNDPTGLRAEALSVVTGIRHAMDALNAMMDR